MFWTRQKPTNEGWYWYWGDARDEPSIMRVTEFTIRIAHEQFKGLWSNHAISRPSDLMPLNRKERACLK